MVFYVFLLLLLADVRRAYLRASLAVHPDKCAAEQAEAAFKKVSEAYEALRDAETQAAHFRDSAAAARCALAHPWLPRGTC